MGSGVGRRGRWSRRGGCGHVVAVLVNVGVRDDADDGVGGEMGILLISKLNTYLFGLRTLVFSLGQAGITIILGISSNCPFYI